MADDGLPALIVEVASESTWRYDVDDRAGKAAGYLALGVEEYLVFDPVGEYLQAHCQGWRQVRGAIEAWRPTVDGRYESRTLGISFQPEGPFLRVIDGQGHPVLYGVEKAREIRRLRAALALHQVTE